MQVEKVSTITQTDSRQLKPAHIPGFNSTWGHIFEFGLTFDGKSNFKDAEKLRMFAQNSLESYIEYGFTRNYNLDELRAIIYYFAKCYEMEGIPPVGKHLQFIHTILDKIRKQLAVA